MGKRSAINDPTGTGVRSRVGREGTSNPDYASTTAGTTMDDAELMDDTLELPADTIAAGDAEDMDETITTGRSSTFSDSAVASNNNVANADDMMDVDESAENSDDIAAARAQIEDTRSHLTETIDAIKEKLSPAHIMEEAKDAAKEKAHDAVSGVVDAVKGAYQAASDKVSDIADHVMHRNEYSSDNSSTEYRSPYAYGSASSGSQWSNIGASIVDTIKVNPLPAAIAGFGLGWLIISMRQQQRSGSSGYYGADRVRQYGDDMPTDAYDSATYGTTAGGANRSNQFYTAPNDGPGLRDRASDIAHNVGDKVSEVAGTVSGKASDIAHTVADKASDIKERASDIAGSVADRAGQFKDRAGDAIHNTAVQTKQVARAGADNVEVFIQENPLAAGAIALLLGAAVGMAFPATQYENRWVGDKRDRLIDQATDAAQNVAHKVQNVAQVAIGQAKDQLGQTVDQAKDQLSQTVDQAKQGIQQAVTETKDTVVSEANNQGLNTPAAAIAP